MITNPPADAAKLEMERLEAWLTVPVNELTARLNGEAFLLGDSAAATRNRFDCRTMKPVPLTAGEKYQADRNAKHAALLREAARLLAAQASQIEALTADKTRLDWLDRVNAGTNERNGTRYGWRYDINHNRAALTDHNYPPLSVREAIDAARAALDQEARP